MGLVVCEPWKQKTHEAKHQKEEEKKKRFCTAFHADQFAGISIHVWDLRKKDSRRPGLFFFLVLKYYGVVFFFFFPFACSGKQRSDDATGEAKEGEGCRSPRDKTFSGGRPARARAYYLLSRYLDSSCRDEMMSDSRAKTGFFSSLFFSDFTRVFSCG